MCSSGTDLFVHRRLLWLAISPRALPDPANDVLFDHALGPGRVNCIEVICGISSSHDEDGLGTTCSNTSDCQAAVGLLCWARLSAQQSSRAAVSSIQSCARPTYNSASLCKAKQAYWKHTQQIAWQMRNLPICEVNPSILADGMTQAQCTSQWLLAEHKASIQRLLGLRHWALHIWCSSTAL